MVTYNGIQDNVHALTLSNLQPAIECRRHRHAVALLRKLSAVESISRVQPAKGACLSSAEAACCLEPRSLEKQCRHICLGAGFPAYFLATYGHSGSMHNLHTYMSTRAENSLLKSSADMPVCHMQLMIDRYNAGNKMKCGWVETEAFGCDRKTCTVLVTRLL